jgi:antirestriction protein ArdC
VGIYFFLQNKYDSALKVYYTLYMFNTNKEKNMKNKEALKAMQLELTEYVVSQLEAGLTWRKAWSTMSAMPNSVSSGLNYKGGNVAWLWYIEQKKGYGCSQWGTFNAWKKEGGKVRKGEKATKIMFFKPVFKEEEGQTVYAYSAIKAYNVFNRDQIDGLEPLENTDTGIKCNDGELFKYTEAEGIKINYSGRAAYSPMLDRIILPHEYTSEAGGWSTVAHEIIHSTGHETRLNRTMSQEKHEYSYEELIAELGSLFLCSQLGLSTDDSKEQSAAYCASWAKVLKSNPDWVWKASAEASRAAEYVMQRINEARQSA